MMASGWRLVGDLIRELIEDGLDDAVIKSQLRAEPSMRSRFLVLYDTVNILVQAGQNNFAVLASATRTYTSVCTKCTRHFGTRPFSSRPPPALLSWACPKMSGSESGRSLAVICQPTCDMSCSDRARRLPPTRCTSFGRHPVISLPLRPETRAENNLTTVDEPRRCICDGH